jgi:DNA-binding FadR family transcriptional regulator
VSERPNIGELHAGLLDALGAEVVSGRLPAGHVLTLEGISAQHGVSRSVAREAVRVLESMGIVESRRRVGITIRAADKWNVFDPQLIRWRLDAGDRAAQLISLSELRRGFEPAAAALAARRGRTHHGMMPERPNTAAIAMHDEVARAIRMRDEDAAEKAMRAIIDEAATAVSDEFSVQPES